MHLWFYFEQTMWTKTLVIMAELSQNLCHIFSNEETSAKTNLIKRAKQRKLLVKMWMMSMIQQKKLPPKLKENSSCDGLKATHGWIMIKKTTAWSAVYVTKYPVTIFLCYESRKFERNFFLYCVYNFKIHSMFDMTHSGNTNFKLERV